MKKRAKSKTVIYDLKPSQPLTARQKREMQKLAKLPEPKIDTSDIPELPPGAWKNALQGKWYRPQSRPYPFAWRGRFGLAQGERRGYLTKANGLLQERCWRKSASRMRCPVRWPNQAAQIRRAAGRREKVAAQLYPEIYNPTRQL